MRRLFIILICIGVGILFVPQQWREHGRKLIGRHVEQLRARVLKEAYRFKGIINGAPSPLVELSHRSLAQTPAPFCKENEADWDETLEAQEKLIHALKLLERDNDE